MTIPFFNQTGHSRISFSQFQHYCKAYLSHRDRPPSSSSSTSSEEHSDSLLSWITYSTKWEWLDPLYPGYAFETTACLSRSFQFLIRLPLLLSSSSSSSSSSPPLSKTTVEPAAVIHNEQHELIQEKSSLDAFELNHDDQSLKQIIITINQTISYSKTWCLPILHIIASTPSGSALTLDHLKLYGVIHDDGTLNQASGVIGQGVLAGGISITDHPRFGLACFYLHPCQTNEALTHVLLGSNFERQTELHDTDQIECLAKETRKGKDKEQVEMEEYGWLYMAAFISLCAAAVEMRAD
ncbi:uncharacterized protein MEPE_05207 [Melanopsichium pennsylvanicum]|uniref:Ubiquitin-like-conjugating enzyme ATG10 n=1 Tax=Melanopsichium pennsylvanicum TaxID=63383 RepID=A0AAJ4XSW7_9BASI|nr:uncharacterized protein MEPE_05207 [Melanopsichium pennsylvanicum]